MSAPLSPLPFGSTIGILGGGQLGRMLALSAARHGYRVAVLDPDKDAPAAQVANLHITGGYEDADALEELARHSAVVTFEWENVPVASARAVAALTPVFPPPAALEAAQDRVTEKEFLNGLGIATAPFRAVSSEAELEAALEALGGEGILKTRRMGYDGKGQRRITRGDTAGAFATMGGVPLILEGLVLFSREVSVIAARGQDGKFASFDPAENVHEAGILRRSTVPAAIGPDTDRAARDAARKILDALGYVGVIGVEFFVLADGGLLANEIAPRVHNSGHWTEAAATLSQFDLHIRAIAGLELPEPMRHSDCLMENLIGDEVFSAPERMKDANTLVHLYGKSEARPGRKMGHWTRLLRGARA
ncbi:MAG: 5-(carboxyamino)imidazole ribonucleotide synthase [Mesorhizobium amorphae]|nr:MAG: 5-(carboxyamino)imidazole ribonucleotide synthase [Mesorhizobium amorphae]